MTARLQIWLVQDGDSPSSDDQTQHPAHTRLRPSRVVTGTLAALACAGRRARTDSWTIRGKTRALASAVVRLSKT
jgi:hypothetical protein